MSSSPSLHDVIDVIDCGQPGGWCLPTHMGLLTLSGLGFFSFNRPGKGGTKSAHQSINQTAIEIRRNFSSFSDYLYNKGIT
jgi:hypothetical protein